MALPISREYTVGELRQKSEHLIRCSKKLIVTDGLDVETLLHVAFQIASCAGALDYIADALEEEVKSDADRALR